MLLLLDPGAAWRLAGVCPTVTLAQARQVCSAATATRAGQVPCQAAAGRQSHRKVKAAVLDVVGMQPRPACAASECCAGVPAGEHTAAKQLAGCPLPEEGESADDSNNCDLQQAADITNFRLRGTQSSQAQTLWWASCEQAAKQVLHQGCSFACTVRRALSGRTASPGRS